MKWFAVILWISPAFAHDYWANGQPVPAWVKSSCCGPEDAHLLREDQVHALSDGIHIDGLTTVVPYARVLPSQDGQIWGFWNENLGKQAPIYCFFYEGAI